MHEGAVSEGLHFIFILFLFCISIAVLYWDSALDWACVCVS